MQLDNTPNLNHGRLFLIEPDERGIVGRWIATSGLGDFQDVGEWSKQAKGCIPPNYKLKGVPLYSVSTKSKFQNLNGLETNTYEISPVNVTTVEGVPRSQFLIHKSRHALPISGSLGCIVLPEYEFKTFEPTFKVECSHLKQVNLLVGYTYDV